MKKKNDGDVYREVKAIGADKVRNSDIIDGDVITAIFANAGRGKRVDWSGLAGSWPAYPRPAMR